MRGFHYGSIFFDRLSRAPHLDTDRRTADTAVVFPDNDASDLVDVHLGEDSQFHETFGYHAHGIDVGVALLPLGWERRLLRWSPAAGAPGRAVCLEPHDLAVARLAAHREKDHVFVAALLDAGLLDPAVIVERSSEVPGRPELGPRIGRWVSAHVDRAARR